MVERTQFGDICSTWGYKGELLTGAWRVVIYHKMKTKIEHYKTYKTKSVEAEDKE